MRKFYSLVLMAAALLIGTNAWANYDASWLQDQFDAIEADGQTHTITMEDDILLTNPVYLGTKTVDEPRKSIILDMNGHHITMDADAWKNNGVYCHIFTITHGELLVRNNASDKATNPSLIHMTGTGLVDSKGNGYNNIFNVAGSYKSSRWQKSGNAYVINESAAINTRDEGWFTHLEIGEGVKLVADATIGGAGISIDGYYTLYHALVSSASSYVKDANGTFGETGLNGNNIANICLYGRSDAPAYNTTLLSSSTGEGVAYGLRVDVYGDIEFATAATSGKTYGIKINGGIRSSLTESDGTKGEKFLNQYCWPMDQAYAKTYGATAATPNSFFIGTTAYENHKLDTIDAPFLYVHSSAHITAAAEASAATAVYCSGYGKTLIEGECKGNSGVNIKSGTVELHDAVITGTAFDYSGAQAGNNATGSGGIIVNSVENRAGGVEVVISGDTKVSTKVGYAIEEVVNTKDGHTDVSSIAIQGGTIEGGNLGAIALTTDGGAATAVTGGNINGNASVAGNTVAVSTLVPNTSQYHTTEVIVDGKTTIVVSQGPAPTGKTLEEAIAAYNAWVAADKTGDSISVKITDAIPVEEGRLEANYEFKELELNHATDAQILTVAAGYTLKVGRVVLGENAQIIVEPGATFIVYGSQGIVAPVVNNIVLESSESKQAYFLFNPGVTSNRHPNATVEFISNGFNNTTAGTFGWQKFGVPTQTGELQDIIIDGSVATAFGRFNYEAATPAWEVIGYLNHTPALNLGDLDHAFEYYQMEHNTATVGTKVTFKGKLVGNDCPAPVIRPNFWNGYANSYSAPIDCSALLAQIPAPADKAFYLYELDVISEKFAWVAKSNLSPKDIQPMQPFLIRNPKADGAALALNYAAAVYTPATTPNKAPARRVADDMTKVEFVVRGENGVDHVIVAQDAQFSAEFDNGYDVAKYMNAEVNMYVTANEKMAIFATDNLENTYVGFQSANGGKYTIEFANVQGDDLTLVDHETGARVLMVEGNTYEFNADANSENDYRFEIVETAKVTTAIENTEAVKSAKGIYTITGQYLGEMNVWNTLPAGVYVVNGEKRVK